MIIDLFKAHAITDNSISLRCNDSVRIVLQKIRRLWSATSNSDVIISLDADIFQSSKLLRFHHFMIDDLFSNSNSTSYKSKETWEQLWNHINKWTRENYIWIDMSTDHINAQRLLIRANIFFLLRSFFFELDERSAFWYDFYHCIDSIRCQSST